MALRVLAQLAGTDELEVIILSRHLASDVREPAQDRFETARPAEIFN